MAAVYPDIHLGWKGRTYTIKPTMKLLNTLEQHFSLARLAHRIATGDTPLSHMAVMVGVMLREAGCEVTDDEVLEELLTGETSGVQEMALALITAAFPMAPKSAAQAEDEPAGKPKAAARRRT